MPPRRLRRELRVRACALAVVALGVLAGGCSYQLGSLLDREGDKTPAASSVGPVVAGSGELPSDTDLAYASAAAVDVLARGGKEMRAPWENQRTGESGSGTA